MWFQREVFWHIIVALTTSKRCCSREAVPYSSPGSHCGKFQYRHVRYKQNTQAKMFMNLYENSWKLRKNWWNFDEFFMKFHEHSWRFLMLKWHWGFSWTLMNFWWNFKEFSWIFVNFFVHEHSSKPIILWPGQSCVHNLSKTTLYCETPSEPCSNGLAIFLCSI